MEQQRARVLLVDDEQHLGRALGRMLDREHAVTVVTRGQEALDRITQGESFELILCDVMMPEMTGMQFYECLSALAPERVKRVVFMSGGAFSPHAQSFLRQPLIHHIEKPVSMTEFRRIVAGHLQRLAMTR